MGKFNLQHLTTVFLLFITLTLTGCKDDEPLYFEVTTEAGNNSISFAKTADNETFTIKANHAWSVEIQKEAGDTDPWITVNPDRGEDNGSVRVDVLANTGSSRSATLKITCSAKFEYISVVQAGGDPIGDGVTLFSDNFQTIVDANHIYEGDGWKFSSTDASYPDNADMGWKTDIFNDDKYIQIAPYNSSLSQVVAFAVMTPFDMANVAADERILTFDYTIFYQTADASKFEVVSSTDYDGNVNTATWTVVEDCTLDANDDNKNRWKNKAINLDSYTDLTTIAFRYTGKDNTYRLDNVCFGSKIAVTIDVTTDDALTTNIGANNAILTGSYASEGVNAVTEVGIAIKGGSITEYEERPTGAVSTTISVPVTGLTASTPYMFYVYVKTADGTFKGDEKQFVTTISANTTILFTENMGNELSVNNGGWPLVDVWAAEATPKGFLKGGFGGFSAEYTGVSASVCQDNSSSDNTGSSGGNHIWIAQSGTNHITIDNIRKSNASTVKLTFNRQGSVDGWTDAANDNNLTVHIIRDGILGEQIAYTGGASSNWLFVSSGGINVAGTTTIGFKFTAIVAIENQGIRIDDVQIITEDAIDPIIPIVTTADADNADIDKTTATLKGSYTYEGAETITKAGIAYRKKVAGGAYTEQDMATVPVVDIAIDLTSLAPSTVYEYYAYTKIGTDEYKGEVKEFTTNERVIEPKAISYVRALKSYLPANNETPIGQEYTIDEDIKIMGTVISSSNTDEKTVIIQDNITPGSGIPILLNVAHTYNLGDVLTIEIQSAKLKYSQNLILDMVSFGATPPITVGANSAQTATTITYAQLTADDSYESMYISIADVKVALAALISATPTMSGYGSGNVPVIHADGNVLMYTSSYASFANTPIPIGSGTLKGIGAVYDNSRQIMPQTDGDFDSLTGTRPMEFGTITFEGSYVVGIPMNTSNFMQIPYYFAQGTEGYFHSLRMDTLIGVLWTGIPRGTYEATTGATPNYVTHRVVGNPEAAGTLTATITKGLPNVPIVVTTTVTE